MVVQIWRPTQRPPGHPHTPLKRHPSGGGCIPRPQAQGQHPAGSVIGVEGALCVMRRRPTSTFPVSGVCARPSPTRRSCPSAGRAAMRPRPVGVCPPALWYHAA